MKTYARVGAFGKSGSRRFSVDPNGPYPQEEFLELGGYELKDIDLECSFSGGDLLPQTADS